MTFFNFHFSCPTEKPVFTIGSAPVINDTDNFSEVSLDRDGNSSEIGHSSDLQADLAYTSPLSGLDSFNNLQTLADLQQQPPPTLDINSNNQPTGNDGNINPIAAFGTAASTVFSTFSSIIKGSSSQTKFEEQQQQQQPQQQPLLSETYPLDNNPISTNPYSYNIQQQPDPNAPVPSFYSPSDEMLFNKKTSVDTPSNTFRLGGNKKKTYAHIPGLSSSQTQSQNVPQNFNINPVMPPLPPQPVSHVDSMPNFQPPPPLNQQSFYEGNNNSISQPQAGLDRSSNKFSFSSLLDKIPVPMNLFGNSEQSNNDYNQQTTTPMVFQSSPQTAPINYFSSPTQFEPPQITDAQSTTVPNYFNKSQDFSVTTEPVVVQQTDMTQNSSTTENASPAVNFFNPQQFNTSPFTKVQQPLTQSQGNEAVDGQKLLTSPPTAAQVFTDNQQGMADVNAPPIFFNPSQASEIFKQRPSDDGKTKNPYSNNRARGVGLYRARTSSSSEPQNVQQLFMPPAASSPQSFAQQPLPSAPSPQLFTPPSFQQSLSGSNDSSRPPSIPPTIPVQNNLFETQHQALPQMPFGNVMSQSATDFHAQVINGKIFYSNIKITCFFTAIADPNCSKFVEPVSYRLSISGNTNLTRTFQIILEC